MGEGRLKLSGTRKSLSRYADVDTVLLLVRELGRIADSATRWTRRGERELVCQRCALSKQRAI